MVDIGYCIGYLRLRSSRNVAIGQFQLLLYRI